MNVFGLPKELDVAGTMQPIRTDYRDILKILVAFNDPNLEDEHKLYVCLKILYKDFEKITDYEAAYTAAMDFIDCGLAGEKNSPKTMDWEQDAPLIFPAVNKAAGFEVRSVEYMHWWTFTGYFMEIRNTIYATVLSLRNKKAKNKKLEKTEKEFWNANKSLCVLKPKLSDEEIAEEEELKAILGVRK